MIKVQIHDSTFCYEDNKYYIRWNDGQSQQMPTRLVLSSKHVEALDQLEKLVNRKKKLAKLLET